MRNGIIAIIILTVLTLSSCNKKELNDTVDVWMYQCIDDPDNPYEQLRQMIADEIINYGQENEIKVELTVFKADELSQSDYTLKRNLSLEQGSVDIIIDYMFVDMYQMAEYAGDYTKLKNYDKIFDNFKGQYCIPLCSYLNTIVADRDVFDEYDLNVEKYFSFAEYYGLKQEMKEKGARFRLDGNEFEQLLQYYMDRNNLKIRNDNRDYILDKDSALNTVRDVSDDLLKYYDMKNIYIGDEHGDDVFDETSKRTLSTKLSSGPFCPLRFDTFTGNDEYVPFDNYAVVISDKVEQSMYGSPSLLINKNTAADNVYEIADYLFTDRFQGRLYESSYGFSPIIESSELKKRLGYDDNWEYIYVPGVTPIYRDDLGRKDIDEIIKVVSDSYEMFKGINTDKLFQPYQLQSLLLDFVGDESLKFAQNANYTEEDFNKSYDDFVMNLNVSYD